MGEKLGRASWQASSAIFRDRMIPKMCASLVASEKEVNFGIIYGILGSFSK